ncbi:BTB/POZ domain-containing protein 16 [Acipenser ruthenus]|uniref:BTB/POZ domain-containing protein 16 n=1 Tax=Acipenser ruthenus TaxID=7906 RepID=A0A444UKY1_ACIRT|nr:BTB/POZ domain-containing protein 16 [Acipenser ruthenus]
MVQFYSTKTVLKFAKYPLSPANQSISRFHGYRVLVSRVPCSRRCRLRKQAGLTNRWQLPDQLGSDFLGKSQAFKAVRAGVVNNSLKRIMTALAVALQNLYFSKPEVEVREAAGVLAAAAELAFQALFQGLFTFSEYHLYRTVLYWVFLQLNPTVQIMPSHSSILTYFISLPKKSALLEKDVGQKYVALFQSLRLHGITANTHLEEIQQINVLPQASLLRLFTKHYYALQSGGDVPYFTDFSTQAMRFGLLIDREPQYRTETISLYGFFFELKAARHRESATYSFSMKRLKYNDPALSFRACERHPFSLLQGREIRYEIKVQSTVEEKWQIFSTGVLSKEFGVTKKSAKSQVMVFACSDFIDSKLHTFRNLQETFGLTVL